MRAAAKPPATGQSVPEIAWGQATAANGSESECRALEAEYADSGPGPQVGIGARHSCSTPPDARVGMRAAPRGGRSSPLLTPGAMVRAKSRYARGWVPCK